jgi:hypothetical protein
LILQTFRFFLAAGVGAVALVPVDVVVDAVSLYLRSLGSDWRVPIPTVNGGIGPFVPLANAAVAIATADGC